MSTMTYMEHSEEVKRYLEHKGWVDASSDTTVTPLSGGVSNQVWKIETSSGQRWVMKQALAKLKVKADWYSDVARIQREQQAMEAMVSLVPQGTIPGIVHKDPEQHVYIMTCAPDEAVTWKSMLLNGEVNPAVSSQAGSLLGMIHAGSAGRDEYAASFADITFFRQLRMDPFYQYLRDHAYPELAPEIDRLMDQLVQGSVLVHGDFSPKNLLVGGNNQVIILDFEVAHWGNPVFDMAFCLAHLMLKGWVLDRKDEALGLIHAFMEGYGRMNLPDLQGHLGVMLLARMDGKSPVEYITSNEMKDEIRKAAIRLVREPQEDRILANIRRIWGKQEK